MQGLSAVFVAQEAVERPAARAAGLLFGMAVVSLGMLAISLCMSSFLSGWRLARRRRKFPGAPWLWEEDWASGHVLPERRDLPGMGLLARFLVLTSFPVLLAVPRFLIEGAFGALALLLLMLLFTLWVLEAARRSRKSRKLGKSLFRPRSLPAVPGEALLGTISIPRRLAAPPDVRLEITCCRESALNDREHQILWEATIPVSRLEVRTDDAVTRIPVCLHLPEDVAETVLDDPLESVTWTLTATAELDGDPYEADFILPVFRRA